ncbi:MAG: hypothetical protein JWM11_5295 [Planctomycetaceae bacterium]|nr:hypothetical protein [Planctomycetaceae bacterium]
MFCEAVRKVDCAHFEIELFLTCPFGLRREGFSRGEFCVAEIVRFRAEHIDQPEFSRIYSGLTLRLPHRGQGLVPLLAAVLGGSSAKTRSKQHCLRIEYNLKAVAQANSRLNRSSYENPSLCNPFRKPGAPDLVCKIGQIAILTQNRGIVGQVRLLSLTSPHQSNLNEKCNMNQFSFNLFEMEINATPQEQQGVVLGMNRRNRYFLARVVLRQLASQQFEIAGVSRMKLSLIHCTELHQNFQSHSFANEVCRTLPLCFEQFSSLKCISDGRAFACCS